MKSKLEKEGELSPEVNSEINQKVEEKVVKAAAKSELEKEKTETTIIEEDNLLDDETNSTEQEKKDDNFTKIEDDDLFDEEDDPEIFYLQPTELDENDPKHNELVDRYVKAISLLNDDNKREMGRDISPDEVFGMFIREVGTNTAERDFNFFKEAFIQSNIKIVEPFNWDELYNRCFSKKKNSNVVQKFN